MFGYVRAFKPYMRVCEFDTYQGVYCGLCKMMGREFGLVSRFTLSYDFTFLALMNMSLNEEKLTSCRQRCIAHPLKKRVCAICDDGLEYPSYAAVILVYHKLRDDLADRGLKGKLRAAAALPFFRRYYKKARIKYPQLADTIEELMKLQRSTEEARTESVDRACEPTAAMMEAIVGGLSDREESKPALKRFGYLLGRYIYICDALDDAGEDHKKGGYNPLLFLRGDPDAASLSDRDFKAISAYAADSVNLTLGELAEAYVKLDIQMYKPIIDNIIYLGLKNVFEQIQNGTYRRKGKPDK
ncbi:DUF5685 family protein [Ruminococcus sp. Marseille-P6503]|uniref:DUF5685 family protein n=1 Tax=Ruminococcus sp. Marseille-P6503 TaxID=2364796 RepID=UPI000F547CE4|nr:DUF5685 family protein [Ruminococcus sp. Marseille-P6503]